MNRADILEVDPKTGAFDVFAQGSCVTRTA